MEERRWISLAVLCAGFFMIILDTTIVNVALPFLRSDLGFTEPGLAWIVNAYVLAFGVLLLVAGRLGDLLGRRRVFLAGLAVFTVASALCAAATSPAWLIAARVLQGAGGAFVTAPILGMVVALFPQPADQAKAIGAYTFVGAGGATLGLVLGGVLTEVLGWRSIFLVNVPIGVVAAVLTWRLVPAHRGLGLRGRVDAPLVPLGLLRSRPVVVANVVQVLGIVAMAGQQFLVALYLARELGYDALQIALATVPIAIVIAILTLGYSARIVLRFGPKRPLVVATALMATGLALLARLPDVPVYAVDLLPAFLIMGAGAGLAMPAWTTLAMSAVPAEDAGLASGLLSTTQQLGIAAGVALLAAVADAASYEAAFGVAAAASLAGLLVTVSTLRGSGTTHAVLPGATRVCADS
jgi:MFS family permease